MSHKYKIGDVLKVKKGHEDRCLFYKRNLPHSYFIEIYALETFPDYAYRILDKNKNTIAFCRFCFTDEDLEPIEKTLDNLEVGNEVVNKHGGSMKVLAKIEEIYELSWPGYNELYLSRYTPHELKELGYTVKNPTPKPEPKEMTVAEVSKALGYEVKVVEE